MKEYYLDLFKYDAWANSKIFKCLSDQSIEDERILTLFGHILAAQYVWLGRIVTEKVPSFPLWQGWHLNDFKPLVKDLGDRWVAALGAHKNLQDTISYKTMKGVPFTARLDHILTHVCNHGTYHRGQITMLVRDKGFEPVSTDYVLYDRDRS